MKKNIIVELFSFSLVKYVLLQKQTQMEQIKKGLCV